MVYVVCIAGRLGVLALWVNGDNNRDEIDWTQVAVYREGQGTLLDAVMVM